MDSAIAVHFTVAALFTPDCGTFWNTTLYQLGIADPVGLRSLWVFESEPLQKPIASYV
jgi:hypothetical protein